MAKIGYMEHLAPGDLQLAGDAGGLPGVFRFKETTFAGLTRAERALATAWSRSRWRAGNALR